jgi:biopolymer transport protein ExbB/TolQ
MKSWKTTLAGLVAAIAAALTTGVLETGCWQDVVLVGALAALGFFARDRNVTGADPEAIARRVAELIQPPQE